MAQRLLLTNDDGTEQIDLFLGVLKCTNWAWNPQPTALSQRIVQLPFGTQASSVGYPQVVEIMTLGAEGCPEDIRAALRQLEEFLENAAAYMDDPVNGDPHWLVWSSEGELGKRALVTGGKHSPVNKPPEIWQQLDGPRYLTTLALTRAPMWEQATTTTVATAADAINSVGGVVSFANVAGRVPARLALTNLLCDDVLEANTITDIWVGIRPEGHGLTAFDPVWECESDAGAASGNATLDPAGDAANQADANASSGYVARVTFSDTALKRQLYIPLDQVVGSPTAPSAVNASHFAGRYLVLCRCKISDDTESVTLQMRTGYTNAGSPKTSHDLITVTNEAAMYLELGEIQIPPPGIWDGIAATTGTTADYECSKFQLELWTQSTTWAGADAHYIDLDCLVLIPTDFFIRISDTQSWLSAALTHRYTAVVTMPNERIFGYYHWGEVHGACTVAGNQWYLPIGNSKLVLAAQRAAGQVIADDLSGAFIYYPRWTNYRE